jgi:hypothetical protein
MRGAATPPSAVGAPSGFGIATRLGALGGHAGPGAGVGPATPSRHAAPAAPKLLLILHCGHVRIGVPSRPRVMKTAGYLAGLAQSQVTTKSLEACCVCVFDSIATLKS